MAWVRIDDHFDEHPKVMSAGPEAMWIFFRALAFANRGETDGHVPSVALNRIGSEFSSKKRRELVARLVEVGLLHDADHDCDRCDNPSDGWRVHDYADYQPTRAQKDAERAEARERMAKVRANKPKRSRNVRSEQVENTTRSSDYPVPVPVPDPLREDQIAPGGAKTKPVPAVIDDCDQDGCNRPGGHGGSHQNPWWDTLTELLGEPSKRQESLQGQLATLARKTGPPEEILRRAEYIAGEWGKKALTRSSLIDHWTRADSAVGRVNDGDVEDARRHAAQKAFLEANQ